MANPTRRSLQSLLAEHFDPGVVRTTFLRLVEAKMLPAGTVGPNGSAQISERHGAVALIALASLAWAEPVDCPAAAQLLAEMRLLGRDGVTLIDTLAGELVAISTNVANHTPSAWRIGRVSVVREAAPRLRFATMGLPVAQLLANPQTIISAELIVEIAGLFRPAAAAVAVSAVGLAR